ncbi:MAG: radical SAM protein [Firmicutes bacterium]|nr:radical SAM protein [Bacillota bacterium]
MAPALTVVVQTTSDCNLRCTYCYVRASRRSITSIPLDALPTLVRNTAYGFDRVKFIWHGGEPLLSGRCFFETALVTQVRLREHFGTEFENVIQTNGTLLTDTWVDFLKENDFRIGLSFDAPPAVHSAHRPPAGPGPGPEYYVDLFARLKRKGFHVGVLCVVSRHNVSLGREVFEFFSQMGVDSYSLLPLSGMPLESCPEAPSDEELFDLFRTTFELWLAGGHGFKSIEPLDTMVRGLLGEPPSLCVFASSCLTRMIFITPDGSIVPCSSLVADEFVLGNVFAGTVREAMSGSRARRLRRQRGLATAARCGHCAYVSICRGGCREDAYWHSGRYDGPYPYCGARKATFDYLRKRLTALLAAS